MVSATTHYCRKRYAGAPLHTLRSLTIGSGSRGRCSRLQATAAPSCKVEEPVACDTNTCSFLVSSFGCLLRFCKQQKSRSNDAGRKLQEVGDESHVLPPCHTDNSRAISAINAKSRLLSLPPELRLRIFEYVLGAVRHHVKIEGDDKKWHLQLAHCEVELDSGHTYRKKTLEEATSSPQNQSDESKVRSDHERHLPCHREWKISARRNRSAKGHKRRLPQSLLLTCKTIHEDAALIMWHNHVFELEFFSSDLERFVTRMSPAQRKATRTIAFNIQATGIRQVMTGPIICGSSGTILTPASLFPWPRQTRDSFLALSRLQRLELFIDAWPGIEAAAPIIFPSGVLGKSRSGRFHMIGEWLPLLERRDLEDVEVRVEEGALRQQGIGSRRNPHFSISAQQRAEWEEQIRLIVIGELDAGKLQWRGE
jgi:hypothetical protein